MPAKKRLVSCFQVFCVFFKIGAITFGGGMSMLPILQKELVEIRHWLTSDEIINYFAISQCTPGVIAVNLATFCGCKRAGIVGAFCATLGVVLPSWIVIISIAESMTWFSDSMVVQRVMKGVYCAVAALLCRAVLTFGKKIITGFTAACIAGLAFCAMSFANISGVYIVLGSGAVGYVVRCIQIWRKNSKKQ